MPLLVDRNWSYTLGALGSKNGGKLTAGLVNKWLQDKLTEPWRKENTEPRRRASEGEVKAGFLAEVTFELNIKDEQEVAREL